MEFPFSLIHSETNDKYSSRLPVFTSFVTHGFRYCYSWKGISDIGTSIFVKIRRIPRKSYFRNETKIDYNIFKRYFRTRVIIEIFVSTTKLKVWKKKRREKGTRGSRGTQISGCTNGYKVSFERRCVFVTRDYT